MEGLTNGQATPEELHRYRANILVFGEPGCGKTTFAKAFYDLALNPQSYVLYGFNVLRCQYEFSKVMRTISIIEIPGDFNNFVRRRKQLYRHAHMCIFMFDLTDVETFNNIRDRWLPEVVPLLADGSYYTIALLANKSDLGNNLGSPIPFEEIYGGIPRDNWRVFHRQLSSIDVVNVMDAFKDIFRLTFPFGYD